MELNEAIREKLKEFNNKPFQKKDGSRCSLYLKRKGPSCCHCRQDHLNWRPGKSPRFSTTTTSARKSQNYSVPYEYIKQKVDVRITKNVIEVFFDGNRICSHPRMYGRSGQYSTIEAHMPPDHQKYVSWNGERFLRWAEKVGEHTAVVVRFFLTSNKVEQQGYKSCMALLKLADKHSVERLDAACSKALSYTVRPSLKSIQAILNSGQDKILEKAPDYLRGAASMVSPEAPSTTRGGTADAKR